MLGATSVNYKIVTATIRTYARTISEAGTFEDIADYFYELWGDGGDLEAVAKNEYLMGQVQKAIDDRAEKIERTAVVLDELTELEWRWLSVLGLVKNKDGEWYFVKDATRTLTAQQKLTTDEALELFDNAVDEARRKQAADCEELEARMKSEVRYQSTSDSLQIRDFLTRRRW